MLRSFSHSDAGYLHLVPFTESFPSRRRMTLLFIHPSLPAVEYRTGKLKGTHRMPEKRCRAVPNNKAADKGGDKHQPTG